VWRGCGRRVHILRDSKSGFAGRARHTHPLVVNSLTPVFINTRVITAITAITAIIVIVGLVVTSSRS
jgi:hypothetical protein